MKRLLGLVLIACGLTVPAVIAANDDDNPSKTALQKLNDFIGGWKGDGGPDRSSKPENWKEQLSWGWKFKGNDAWLTVEFKDAKYFSSGELRYLPAKQVYQFTAVDKSKNKLVFEGKLEKNYLNLDRVDPKTGDTQRIRMNSAAGGIRFVYTYLTKPKGRTIYAQVYQVALSKEGEALAGGGAKDRECVVTGGLGTMTVSYMGKTYYVCCSGCRDAFLENPEKILKDYEARKKAGR
jgi:hypothetical protein